MVSYFFFFFKQKTAYEILARLEFRRVLFRSRARAGRPDGILAAFDERLPFELTGGGREIGRASCRERVYISVGAVSLKKKDRQCRSEELRCGDIRRVYGVGRGQGPLTFFFSSRRRHTRYWRDWSSDVCSSDLRWA